MGGAAQGKRSGTTRRAVLAGSLALPAIRARAAPVDLDVAIVGAGAAGIAAARVLQAAGVGFVLLEARDRIGGRAFTQAIGGATFDAGAHFIHWAERNPWSGIAAELGEPLDEDRWGGPAPVVYSDGRRLPPEERARRRNAFGRAAQALTPNGADRSFAEAVASEPREVQEAVRGTSLFSLGEEPERVSVADYDQLWAGDDRVPRNGFGVLVARAGAGLPVRLSTPVEAIRYDGSGIVVETRDGPLAARLAIVTVPVGVLKSGAIRFVPDLPDRHRTALDGLGMGALTKIVVALERARLPNPEANDYFVGEANGERISLTFFPRGRPIALATLGGDYARRICEAGEAAAEAEMRRLFVRLLGADADRAITATRLAGWWSDPFARGSYSILQPGRSGAREALAEPIADRLALAGEASAGGGAMTVGGASLEGARAARWAIASLRSGRP